MSLIPSEDSAPAPEAAQPFGTLLLVSPDLVVERCAGAAALGRPAGELLGRPLRDLLPGDVLVAVRAAFGRPPGGPGGPVGACEVAGAGPVLVFAHHHAGTRAVEVVPVPPADGDPAAGVDALAALAGLLTEPLAVDGFAQALADRLWPLLGYDRFAVYRFDEAGAGRVLAAAARPGSDPFPGPAFPLQSRDEFARGAVWVLADALADTDPLAPAAGGAADLSHCVLRAASPAHRARLAAGGVRAALVMPVLKAGRPWGLLACHHATPRVPPAHVLSLCGGAARLLAAQAELAERRDPAGVRRNGVAAVAVADRLRLKQAVVRHARDAVVVTEAEPIDGPGPRIVYVNPAFSAMTGYSEAEVLGKTPRILQGPGTDPAERARIRAALGKWKPVRAELRNYRKDGTEFWAEMDISPVADEAGWYTHWIAVQRDVTDRKAAESAVRDSERLLREVTDATPNLVAVKAPGGRFLLANRALAAGYGLTPEAMRGRADADVSPDPAAAELSADAERRALATGETVRVPEIEFRTAAGARVYLETAKVPLAGPGGRPDRVLCVSVDVTARREAARALEESNRVYRLLAGAVRDVVFLLGAGGRVEYASPSCDRAFGAAPEAFAGRPLADVVHPDDAGVFARSVADALAGRPSRAEWRWRPAAGRDVWVEGLAGPAGDGGAAKVVLAVRDVTERRALEDQFRQAQKLEAVGQLAGGVAHDFNNLLTVVAGSAEELLGALAGHPARRHAEDVAAAAARGAGLTRQLLAFSRRQAVRPVPLDLNAVVAGVAGLVTRLLGESVRLALELAPGLPAVRADAGMVEQVVMNLAVNARDAMPGGGRVVVATAAADTPVAAGLPPGRYVRLTVRDTGHGVPDDVRARLFEPFFTTKPAGRGTGLGLATVHGIAHQFGGGVGVESAPGAGAAFHVDLPVTDDVPLPQAPAAADAPAARPAAGGHETVLVVEDDDAVRTLTVTVLKRAGYRVLAAAGAADAVRACDAHPGPVHLVLTDVVMPGQSGRELAEELRAKHPGLRVAFQSGYTEDAALRRGVRRDGERFLQKPYTAARLAQFVRAALDAPAG